MIAKNDSKCYMICSFYQLCFYMAVVGLERAFYEVPEDVGVVEVYTVV